MEIKANRYPLRQYKHLGAGFDIHSRPNYYESDQEEEDCRKRRHSISSLAQEGEGVNRSNLEIVRQRRYSEGATLLENRRAIEGSDVEEVDSNLRNDGLDNDESDSDREDFCITETLTYTSKKQVIQVFKTKHLNVNKQQRKAVYKRLCQLASKDRQPKNGSLNCKNKKDGLSKKQPIHPNSTDLLSSIQLDDQDDIEREMENIHGHPQEEEDNRGSESNNKNYFLAQLNLQSLHRRDLEENAGRRASENEVTGEESSVLPSEGRILEMKDKETQTENCFKKITSSSDKPKKFIKKDKSNESKTPPKSSGEKLSPLSKSLKKDKKIKFSSKTDPAKNISDKAKLVKDSCKNLELHSDRSKPNVNKTSNGRSDGCKKETTRLSENKPPEYHEVLKMACENMLKPDTAVKKKTVSTSTSNESRSMLTKENKQTSGCSGLKKVSETETVGKEKRRSKVTKDQQSAGCSGLGKMNKTETVGKEKTRNSVTKDQQIAGCSGLGKMNKTETVSKEKTRNSVTKEDRQIAGCSGLGKMNKTETVSKEKIRSKVTKDQQSAGCSGLGKMNKTETVSKEKMRSKVTKEDHQSAGCSGLGKMNKTETVSKEKTRNSVTKEDQQIAGCSGLGKMSKTETVSKEKMRSKVTKEDHQSAGCSGLGKMNKTETVSKEKTGNSVTKQHDQTAGCSGFEKMNRTETANKEKTSSVEKTKKSEATKDLISCEDKEKTTKTAVQNIQPSYNMEDLENKLQRLFEEPDNQNLSGGSSIETIPMKAVQQNQNDSTNNPKPTHLNLTDSTNKPKTNHLNQTNSTNKQKSTDLNHNNSTNKPSQHLNLHKVKDKINKSTKKPTNPKPWRHSDKPTSSQSSSAAEMGASITMEMVEQLHEKGRALFETKPMLEKRLWPDRQAKTASTLNSTEQKAKEDKRNVEEPSKEDVIEKGNDQCGEASNTTAVDSKEAESNELLGDELLVKAETQIELEKFVVVSWDSIERDSESIEIVEYCCCCSPITIPEVLPNENSNSDNQNLHSNTQEVDNPLKTPEESGKSDSITNDENGGTCTGTSLEFMSQDESEQDEDRRKLIAALTDPGDIPLSPLNCQEVETESENPNHAYFLDLIGNEGFRCILPEPPFTSPSGRGIAKNSNAKKPASDVQVNAAGMEHYKKRLIHQHEKPGAQICPYATAEEDDDSWESPLSPASSNVSRDSGQQDRRKEDVVQKVARKRAVCRSQFRHQNMELFKLGHSIPTSLCKTKEPYNVCAEKNLQMCYQNGGSKKCDKNPARGSLTESIINTMEGSKKKDVPLWRSVSLDNELERQIAPLNNNEGDSKNSGGGRHVLPAIVPELPERRKNRLKSLPESSVRSTRDNAEAESSKSSNEGYPRSVYDFTEENEEVAAATKKSVVRQKSREESGEPRAQDIVEAHTRSSDSTSVIRRQSTSSESDVLDCVPINLSMKNRDANGPHPTWSDAFGGHHAKRNEPNYNQHLAYSIPKQPSNVPKKPPHPPEEIGPRRRLDEGLARTISENLDASHLDKDGNCFFVASIPGGTLDPQKESKFFVISLPQLQQQMARMERPHVAMASVPEPQHSQMEMLDSAIMSLVDVVKSSVQSVFNILSLPVLNRLYIDLSRYLHLPAVSKMKFCIHEALDLIVSYVLVNMLHERVNSKLRDFVHKMMQLDLRPHMDFIVNSIEVIRKRIRYDHFTEHLLEVFARNPSEDFPPPPPPRNARRPVADHPDVRALMQPPPQQFFPGHSQPPEFRDCYGRPWAENPPYQHANPVMANPDLVGGGAAQGQPQKRGRRQHQEADRNLLASTRVPETFHEPNLATMRPDLYLADNRCIPPNVGHMRPEALTNLARAPKGRPRNLNKPNKVPNKLPDNTFDLSPLTQGAMLEPNQLLNYREKTGGNVPNGNVSALGKAMHRNGDVATHRDVTEENVQFRKRPRLTEERRSSEGASVPDNVTGNGGDFSNGQRPPPVTKNYEVRNDSDRRNNAGIFSKDRLMQTLATVINDGNNVQVTHATPMSEIRRHPAPEPRNVSRNNPEPPSGARRAVILGNEIVHRKKQVEPNAKVTTKNTQDGRVAVAKQCPVSDVEQFLQTNIIVNKHQPATVARGSVLENVTPTKNITNPNEVAVCEGKGDQRTIEKVVNEYRFDKDSVPLDADTEKTNARPVEVMNTGTDSNTIGSNVRCNREREGSRHSQSREVIRANDGPEVVSSTVIIKDKSMEISKGDTSLSENVGVPGVANSQMDLDDVILERVSLNGELRNGISYSSGRNEGAKPSGRPKEMEKGIGIGGSSQERLRIIADVSIEKVTDNFDAPPKLIKLTTLKRKVVQEDRQQKRRLNRWPVQGGITDEIVIIEDDDKGKEELDYNQNNVGEGDKSKEASEDGREKSAAVPEPQADAVGTNDPSKTPKQAKAKSSRPLIEDISSDEEVLAPFRLYSTYENKVNGDPRKILQTTEVSEITLIDDNVAVIENANRHLFEKPPVYTRPVMPRKLRKSHSEDPESWNEPLAKMVQFSEDSGGLTCSLKVKNSELKYPSNIDVRRYSPVASYQHPSPTKSPRFSPTFKSPPRPVRASPGVVQTSPGVRRSPAVPTSPTISGPPKAQTVTRLPVDQTSPAIVQMPPIGLASPHLNESEVNWRHWFAEEERNGVFNFERSQSLESNTLSGQSVEALSSVGSDYCAKFPSEEPLYEIKIDSKSHKITKGMLEKIPRGKLCYVRETNTFIRYFDDKQMELFINNLNLGEGSTVASDLLKQVRGRAEGPSDVETPPVQSDKSEKGEVITLSKDVVFSTQDYLLDPVLYVEEVEKVQRYVPKDFYEFYRFVTGYQIIRNNSPISFQTFLTMHNTNGIRGLFKKYVNSVVEGPNIL